MDTNFSGLSGQQIGVYTLEEKLSEGARSVVYAARDREGGACVIKLMSREGLDDLGLQRLRRELAALSDLEHENLVRVHGFGDYEGRPYVVMERIEGAVPLHRFLALCNVSLAERVAIFERILLAVMELHEAGLVHGHLNASNVLLGGESGVPKLMALGASRRGSPDRDRVMESLGTEVLYVPPEEAGFLLGWSGKHEASAGDDIYALGLLLYMLLTGRHPFAGDAGRSPEDLLERIHEGAVEHPRRVCKRSPKQLSTLATIMMSKERRPPTARLSFALFLSALRVDVQEPDFHVPRILGFTDAAEPPREERRVPARASMEGERSFEWERASLTSTGMAGFGLVAAVLTLMLYFEIRAPRWQEERLSSTEMESSFMRYDAALEEGGRVELPTEPMQSQARAPCRSDEREINGLCWYEVSCSKRAFSYDGKCYEPAVQKARRKKSSDR